MVPDKVARVVGLAASVPFDKADPAAPINRRISIVVMTKQAEDAAKAPELTRLPPQPSLLPPMPPTVRPSTSDSTPAAGVDNAPSSTRVEAPRTDGSPAIVAAAPAVKAG
jgi:chemotaxis protein MotB